MWILFLSIATFVIYELYVFLVVHRRLKDKDQEHDLHTLSELVWRFQRRFGLPAKFLVGFSVVLLFIHLVFEWP
jgi:hypothetical protein